MHSRDDRVSGPTGQVTGAGRRGRRVGRQYSDPESGLQNLRARYYDPTTGQFLTRDLLEQLTQQPYAYAGDDPINGTDPTGLLSLGDVLQGLGVGAVCVFTDGAGCVAAGLADLNANVVSNDVHAALKPCSAVNEAEKSFGQVVALGLGTGISAMPYGMLSSDALDSLRASPGGRFALTQLKTLGVTSGTLGSLAYGDAHPPPPSDCSCTN